MLKFLSGVGITVGLLALPMVTLAAIPTNVLFDNGLGNVPASPGSTVNMDMYVTTSNSEAVESVFVTFPGAGGTAEQGQCYAVSPMYDNAASPAGGWLVSASVVVPTHPGSWPVRVRTYGISGDGADVNCLGTSNGTGLFNNRINVADGNGVATPVTNTNTGDVGGASSTPSWVASMNAQFAALAAALSAAIHPPTPPTPVMPSECAALTAHMQGAAYGVRNSSNVVLQGFLLSEHEQIPALAAGASFGLWLDQTQAALAHFKSVNSCQ